MEKKKHPPIHKGIITALKDWGYLWEQQAELIAFLHGELDSKCPPEFLPDMISGLESVQERFSAHVQRAIGQAIANLKAQLEGHEAENRPGP